MENPKNLYQETHPQDMDVSGGILLPYEKIQKKHEETTINRLFLLWAMKNTPYPIPWTTG